jgi:hypothetical protein
MYPNSEKINKNNKIDRREARNRGIFLEKKLVRGKRRYAINTPYSMGGITLLIL